MPSLEWDFKNNGLQAKNGNYVFSTVIDGNSANTDPSGGGYLVNEYTNTLFTDLNYFHTETNGAFSISVKLQNNTSGACNFFTVGYYLSQRGRNYGAIMVGQSRWSRILT
jgi:hypothetical protein